MDRLRGEVAELRVTDSSLTLGVTVSIGVAELARDGEDVWSCLRRADHALYEAKHAGRNCISLAA
ncbi:diguanylate cyclase [compost metagenome]